MHPEIFLKTIYLGDRSCKSILIDGWSERVVIQVDQISRIRSESGQWEFYTEEDIIDGLLVFTGVRNIKFEPTGYVPNDLINSIEVMPIHESDNIHHDMFLFRCSIDSADSRAVHTEVIIELVAQNIHLECPQQPNLLIQS